MVLSGTSVTPRRVDNKLVRRRVVTLVLMTVVSIACGYRGEVDSNAPILLFDGAGTSPNDVTAVKAILDTNHLAYAAVNSAQLNKLDESQLRQHRLLIVPGGNFIHIGKGLTAGATANVRSAVQNGLNYLGICAGGFLAGDTGVNSFKLTSVKFGPYSIERQGITKAMVTISSTGAGALDQYWELGPQFTGWGAVVAKYPDGTPAVTEGPVGKGWALLVGFHPEAPESWRHGMTFTTRAADDNAYAGTLIRAALNRVALRSH